MITTCNVTCVIHDQNGNPEVGATVRARLSQYEVYQGYVVPEMVVGTTDAAGSCTIALWPNELGATESVYDITISAGGRSLRTTASVPNLTSAKLHEISLLPPYEGKSEGQIVLEAGIDAAASASSDATATAADRVQTGLDATATAADAVATAADRVQTGLDKTATNADAAATAADRVQTGLDKTSTAADRVQTGLDKTATNADAAATAADRVQTGIDKTATAADRVQTGLDLTATNQDTLDTAADRVQTGLDKTATAADASATAADRVQTGLDKTATAADASATAADRVQTGLDKTASAADRVQTGLDATATAADRVQTGLDATATAADRVQTGLDATATAADAVATAADRVQTDLDKTATAASELAAYNSALSLDLTAIADSKAITMVAGCIDTSPNPSLAVQARTSWYNEALNTATRGSRKEMPTRKVVIAEASKVTIYDGDDPSLPMWMVFNSGVSGTTYNFIVSGSITSIKSKNNRLYVGRSTSMVALDFARDERNYAGSAGVFNWNGSPISERNTLTEGGSTAGKLLPAPLVNNTVNAVAMTVLPNAPIDPVSGLQIPTIAVGTAGGVSVIKHDGTVSDSVSVVSVDKVVFSASGLWWSSNFGRSMFFATTLDIDAGDGFGDELANSVNGQKPFYLPTRALAFDIHPSEQLLFGGGSPTGTVVSGLTAHKPNYTDQTKGMSALLTSTYNTGWMVGDIKAALLSSTDATSLVGSGELVTNGTGDSTVGWLASTANVSVASVGGQLEVTNNGAGWIYQSFPTVIGQRYYVTNEFITKAGGGRIYIGTAIANFAYHQNTQTAATNVPITFIATTTEAFISLGDSSGGTGVVNVYDNLSVKLADEDRSVANKGLIVNGTVTRTAVATGAELVAYSGFSASNYLEQPFNSALDFGTGDFCVMGWIKSTQSGVIIERCDVARIGALFELYQSTDNMELYAGTSTTYGRICKGVNPRNAMNFVCVGVKNGSGFVYVNGVNVTVFERNPANVSNTSAVTRLGCSVNGTAPAIGAVMALMRISATAPSDDQIAKIYADEKPMFNAGSQVTLYGTSDAVTALGHDEVTGLDHIGTSAGRSDFSGLIRVGNTTTPVTTAIAAHNSLVLEQ